MTEIVVPKLNANDTTYTLVEWLVPPGATVGAGDPVATVETSKAAEELPSPADGCCTTRWPSARSASRGRCSGGCSPPRRSGTGS